MSQSFSTPTLVTEDDYLRMEEAAETRHEFRDGKIIDIAGGTEQHAAIAANLIGELRNHLKSTPCRAYGSDLRLRVADAGDYVYPDVMVICGPVEFHRPPSRSTVVNPRLIIEVTSASTESDDRGRKFSNYRTLESLEEFVLVSQERMEVETYYRQADRIWAIGPRFTAANKSVQLRSLKIEITMAEIYARVELNPSPNRAPPVLEV